MQKQIPNRLIKMRIKNLKRNLLFGGLKRKQRILFLLIFITGILSSSLAENRNTRIAIVTGEKLTIYDKTLSGFNKALERKELQPAMNYYLTEKGKEIELAKKIRLGNPDLILTVGSAATSAISKSIKDIPIVFSCIINPVKEGIVKNMKSSGNNTTGVSLGIPALHQFQTLKSIIPSVKKIGVIYDPNKSNLLIGKAEDAAKRLGLVLKTYPVYSEEDIPQILEGLKGEIDILWAIPDTTVFTAGSARFILLSTLRNKLPLIGFSAQFVKAGALFSLYCDYEDIGKQTCELVLKVMAGEKPTDLSIRSPRKPKLAINLTVATLLGIKIPAKITKKADKTF